MLQYRYLGELQFYLTLYCFRLVSKKKDDGSDANRVIPYVIDLGSSNGTYLNNTRYLLLYSEPQSSTALCPFRIESKRYYELKVTWGIYLKHVFH